MARCAGRLRSRRNWRTLLSLAQRNESLPTADSSSPVIAVMQPAHALLANHCTVFQRACPASRRLLVQPQVRSVVVIIGNVLGEESLHGSQSWPRLLALKDGELLAKGEGFGQQTAARPQPAKHGSE